MILYVDEDHANTNDSEWNYVNMNDEGTQLFHDTLPLPPNTLKVE